MSQRRRVGMFVAIAGLAVGSAMAAGSPASGTPSVTSAPSQADAVKAAAVGSLMSTGLSQQEATRRIEAQPAQLALADQLTGSLKSRAAGAFIDEASGKLVINVTDSAAATEVRSAGATPRIVTRTPAQLAAVQTALTKASLPTGTGIGVDVRTDQVVLTVPATRDAATNAFIAQAAQYGSAVRVDTAAGRFERQLIGGDAILGPGFRCSAAFIARRSNGETVMITAGHCTEGGPSFTTSGGQAIGPTIISSFPGNDYGVVRVTNPTAVNAQGTIRNGSGTVNITSSANPVVGSTACKSGSTTGTTCGRINSNGNTVNYGGGDIVNGMTFSNICTQPGDSGGGLFTTSVARGIVSGGTVGGCTSTSISIFNPVQEALNAAGATVL